MSSYRRVSKSVLTALAAPLALAIAAPAQAQQLADLQSYEEVAPLEPTVLDGVWKVVGLQKEILIENGHAIALEQWIHAFFWTVEPGMVTSTRIRQNADGRFEAYDALLQRPMKWTLREDGTIYASGTGLFAPSFYLEPIELVYPDAFQEELDIIASGGRAIGAPPPLPGPPPAPIVDDSPPERPGPIEFDAGLAYPLQGRNQMCLDVSRSNATKQGAQVMGWECHGGNNQKFFFLEEEGLIVTGAGMCLEATGKKKGSVIKSYGCDGNPMQQWTASVKQMNLPGFGNIRAGNMQIMRFTHSSGRCLDISRPDSDKKKNGAKVMLWDCHGGETQAWGTLLRN
ncbi:ricin-type beta-trefoil lectin domain protein [Altererythrobacter sp. GH1-8]|uniref:ricin-type beta-trefoil lectin domain protein n=1 Tax=Altererythrobacter sp. GH1-8 TaxID=3349333 RepID=UPI00374D8FFD